MAYNHGREERKWHIWKEAEEKILCECGVDEAVIEQICTDGGVSRRNFSTMRNSSYSIVLYDVSGRKLQVFLDFQYNIIANEVEDLL